MWMGWWTGGLETLALVDDPSGLDEVGDLGGVDAKPNWVGWRNFARTWRNGRRAWP